MTVKVQQSANDKRLYRYVVLPNGLQAVLISDPEAKVDESEEHSHDQDHDHEHNHGDDSDCSDCYSDSHMEEDTATEVVHHLPTCSIPNNLTDRMSFLIVINVPQDGVEEGHEQHVKRVGILCWFRWATLHAPADQLH